MTKSGSTATKMEQNERKKNYWNDIGKTSAQKVRFRMRTFSDGMEQKRYKSSYFNFGGLFEHLLMNDLVMISSNVGGLVIL